MEKSKMMSSNVLFFTNFQFTLEVLILECNNKGFYISHETCNHGFRSLLYGFSFCIDSYLAYL